MMRGDWQEVSRLAKSKNTNAASPDPVEGQLLTTSTNAVRPELVEGHSFTNSPSTSSGRTINTTTVQNKENQT